MRALTARLGIHYGWVILGVTFLVMLGTAGVRALPSLAIIPLEAEFGWDRATISSAISINVLLLGLTGPIVGRLLDKWGVKRLMLIALILSALGQGLSVFVATPLDLQILWGVIMGLVTGFNGMVLAAAVATRWFNARRGLAVAILSSATSAGQMIFVPLLMAVVLNLGWRPAVLVIAAILTALIPLVIWLGKDDPAQVGLEPYGSSGAGPVAGSSRGPAIRDHTPIGALFRQPAFWMLIFTFFTCGFTGLGMVSTHAIPHWIEIGIPEQVAASAYVLIGATNFIGTMASGWLSDRYSLRRLLAIYYGFRGLSILFLPFASDSLGMGLFAVVYGLDAVATIPPTVALCGELFGKRSVGFTYGSATLAHQFGAALAAFAGGWMHDIRGDYDIAFYGTGLLALIAAVVALRIPKARPMPIQAPVPLVESTVG